MVRVPELIGDIPSILVEVSFITNSAEEPKLQDPDYLDGNGWAIYAGIADYFGFAPIPRSSDGACCNQNTGVCTDNVTLPNCTGTGLVYRGDGTACATSPPCASQCGAGNCLINGVCYSNGAINPNNVCQLCNSSVSQTGWSNRPSVTACGNSNTSECDAQDTCDGSGNCFIRVKPAATVCRPATGDCDEAETCNGSSTACPADVSEPDGTICDDGNATTCDDVCVGGTCQGRNPPCDNDLCAEATPIAGEGGFAFDNTNATTDGLNHSVCNFFGQPGMDRDVWFCWTSPCTGTVVAETCGMTAVDTKIAVYDGCACPATDVGLLDCDDDSCAVQTRVTWDADANADYLIRVGTFPGSPGGPGALNIQCTPPPGSGACCQPQVPHACQDVVPEQQCRDAGRYYGGGGSTCSTTDCDRCHDPICDYCWTGTLAENNCPQGWNGDGTCDCGCQFNDSDCPPVVRHVLSSNPPHCAIDARIPFTGGVPANVAGFTSITLTFDGAAGATEDGAADYTIQQFPAGAGSVIQGVVLGGNTATITFMQPIQTKRWTCVLHNASNTRACLGYLPADANADRTAAPVDILDIIDNLNGVRNPPLVPYQCDIDRSNLCAPADILSEIDLLNGASGFPVSNGTTLTSCPSTQGP